MWIAASAKPLACRQTRCKHSALATLARYSKAGLVPAFLMGAAACGSYRIHYQSVVVAQQRCHLNQHQHAKHARQARYF